MTDDVTKKAEALVRRFWKEPGRQRAALNLLLSLIAYEENRDAAALERELAAFQKGRR